MTVYYNEVNAHAAGWLENLIADGLIPAGHVDRRDIRDVCASDLAGYTSAHFFAGIGLWPYALRQAGWPDDRPVWTGSCPCQPFSGAGKGAGFADERHLWTAWFWLIEQHRPCVVFGEQVASADGLMWFDLVSSDMEGCAYAIGATDFPSAGVGAPNIRQRLWWVADAHVDGQRVKWHERGEQREDAHGRCHDSRLAHSEGRGRREHGLLGEAAGGRQDARQPTLGDEAIGRLGNASSPRLSHAEPQAIAGTGRGSEGRTTEQPSGALDPWRQLEWIDCIDGKRRPAQPGIFPLASRRAGDVAKLRAYGNAINPVVAAEVIRAYMEVRR